MPKLKFEELSVHCVYGLFEYSLFLRRFNEIVGKNIKTREEFVKFIDEIFNESNSNKLCKSEKEQIVKLIKLTHAELSD
jgi:hypothetical protein